MTPKTSAVSARSAFTLIELLVVIGIIGVVIAILIPTLAKARVQAKLARCSANLRQVGLMFYTYGSQNGGRLPPLNAEIPGKVGEWYYDYLERARLLSGDLIENGTYFTQPIARCSEIDEDTILGGWGGGYGVNESHLIRYAPAGGSLKLGKLRRSSQLWLIGDVGRPWTRNLLADVPWVATFAPPFEDPEGLEHNQRPIPRHRGRVNICFADGHVDQRRYDELASNRDGIFTP